MSQTLEKKHTFLGKAAFYLFFVCLTKLCQYLAECSPDWVESKKKRTIK